MARRFRPRQRRLPLLKEPGKQLGDLAGGRLSVAARASLAVLGIGRGRPPMKPDRRSADDGA